MAGELSHAFLDKYPVCTSARVLILGTIHPDTVKDFLIPFFYGNRGSLWRLFAKAYPNEKLDPANLDSVLSFLRTHRIGVSDVVRKGERIRTRSGDGDLRIKEYNHALIDDLCRSQIDTVVCTGGNHPKGVFYLFTRRIMQLSEVPDKLDQFEGIRLNFHGRNIRICAMPSPSGAANRGIARSKGFKEWASRQPKRVSVDDFKVYSLKKIFDPFISPKSI